MIPLCIYYSLHVVIIVYVILDVGISFMPVIICRSRWYAMQTILTRFTIE